MKKTIHIILTAVFSLGLTACGSDNNNQNITNFSYTSGSGYVAIDEVELTSLSFDLDQKTVEGEINNHDNSETCSVMHELSQEWVEDIQKSLKGITYDSVSGGNIPADTPYAYLTIQGIDDDIYYYGNPETGNTYTTITKSPELDLPSVMQDLRTHLLETVETCVENNNLKEIRSFDFFNGGGLFPIDTVSLIDLNVDLDSKKITGKINSEDQKSICDIQTDLSDQWISKIENAIDNLDFENKKEEGSMCDGPSIYIKIPILDEKVYYGRSTCGTFDQPYYQVTSSNSPDLPSVMYELKLELFEEVGMCETIF